MKYLRKVWIRILISFIGGGMLSEIIHISTGDPNRPHQNNFSWYYAIAIFVLLTVFIWVKTYYDAKPPADS